MWMNTLKANTVHLKLSTEQKDDSKFSLGKSESEADERYLLIEILVESVDIVSCKHKPYSLVYLWSEPSYRWYTQKWSKLHRGLILNNLRDAQLILKLLTLVLSSPMIMQISWFLYRSVPLRLRLLSPLFFFRTRHAPMPVPVGFEQRIASNPGVKKRIALESKLGGTGIDFDFDPCSRVFLLAHREIWGEESKPSQFFWFRFSNSRHPEVSIRVRLFFRSQSTPIDSHIRFNDSESRTAIRFA